MAEPAVHFHASLPLKHFRLLSVFCPVTHNVRGKARRHE